jgi:hypothetical protein
VCKNTNKQPGNWIKWPSFLMLQAAPLLLFLTFLTAYWQRGQLGARGHKRVDVSILNHNRYPISLHNLAQLDYSNG